MNIRQFITERRSTILSAVLAVGIIVIGFLAFTTLSSKPVQKEVRKTPKQVQQQPQAVNNNGKNVDATSHGGQINTSSPGQVNATRHTVTRGESLSEIAQAYYGDGNKWTLIAAENKLANPNVIHRGNVLTIPGVSASSNTIAQKPVNPPTAKQPKTYTVKSGDNLWVISQMFFGGDGYQWFKIRDANPGKVGLLPNGRPLIVAGTVLTIPTG